jgi:hypothetical protein
MNGKEDQDESSGILDDGSMPENDHETSDMDDGTTYSAEEELQAMLR